MKQINKTVQALRMEIETRKKMQAEWILEQKKNVGIKTRTIGEWLINNTWDVW